MARVLVIIPALNEEETIGDVIAALKTLSPGYDVLVVDDGSRDRTPAIVQASDHALLVRLPYNLGIGGAMQTGFKYALRMGYDIAIQCDADGQHPVEAIPALVERLAKNDADVVIGSRYVAASDYTPSLSRRIGKSILSRLVDALIGGGITDTTSGFRALNRQALRVFAERYPDDYPEAEALVILHMCGLRAVEIPVAMHQRKGGATSIKPPHAVYYMVKVGLAIFVDLFRSQKRPAGDS